MSWMFKLRGPVTSKQSLVFGTLGFALILFVWVILTSGDGVVSKGILPKPFSKCDSITINTSYIDEYGKTVTNQVQQKNNSVICAYGDLVRDNSLFKHLCLSLSFNFGGYIKALLFSLPIAFIIGLFPVFRATFQAQIDAYRFIPLTALTGIFLALFGLAGAMKINFLAFGIMIYLIPIIIQRIREVDDVYLKTVYTLGADKWQTIKSVYIPAVLSKLSDDVRVLTAISWTYIIVAEGMANQGGLGSLIFFAGKRAGRVDKVFAILILFVIIGLVQDRLFLYLDKKFFPHKYQIKEQYSNNIKKESLLDMIWDYIIKVLGWLALAIYVVLALDQYFGILGHLDMLSYLFQDTIWVPNVLFLLIIGTQLWKPIRKVILNRVPAKTTTA